MRFGSLFSGIGGLDLGLEWSGMTVAWQCEKDPFCRGVLRQHWPHARLYDDITTLDATDLAPVDLICGGFPCQPVSLAGRRRGSNDARWLWPAMRDIISHVRPSWVLGENTPGLITMGLDGVLFDLEALGYACRTFVIPACAVDAPHRRDRVFIVAHADSGLCNAGGSSEPGQEGWESFTGDGGEGAVANAAHVDDDRGGYGSSYVRRGRSSPTQLSGGVALADASRLGRHGREDDARGVHDDGEAAGWEQGASRAPDNGHVVNTQGLGRRERRAEPEVRCRRPAPSGTSGAGPWSDAEWITGADGKARRIKSGIHLLAHGIPGRVARLKSLGNAVVPEVGHRLGRAIMAAHYGSGD